MVRRNIFVVACGLAAFGLLASAGCGGGGTDGDGGTDFSPTFVASEATVGRIDVRPSSTSLPVGATTGFGVQVTNQNGQGVPQIQVTCDSEQGIAIISPSAGFELTDNSGFMSGTIGCSAPGSFQFGCRLPIGSNLREFETIICTGEIPAGFDGFAGSAGGGLGGGVQIPDGGSTAGGDGPEGVELIRIDVVRGIGDSAITTEIDTTQVDCNAGLSLDEDCEAFSDDIIQFTIENNSNQSVRFTSYNYTVPNADGAGRSFTSVSLALNSVLVGPGGSEEEIQALFTEIVSGSGACSLEKRFPDASFNVPGDLGFRNVTFRLNGVTELGEEFTLTGRTAISFDNFDNC